MKNEMDLDEFIADVFDVIGGMGIWPRFVKTMEEDHGYTSAGIEEGFTRVAKKVGREN